MGSKRLARAAWALLEYMQKNKFDVVSPEIKPLMDTLDKEIQKFDGVRKT